ncbi:AraC family transcriptional regulator [Bradyrhizobium neotropicale]|uniref:AraC family transcriptional regulator n=1 Tax=Bradyrhizobium neotropicale TaxID=1497615 RepID=UPI001AD783E4|nr:AraC family transcriptional regulator [Bradyrhizobium neotropicale]MBO4221863.1 helix-turn-helix domain-containing protein [Bradyrhizobium neotropicale]
MERLFLNSDVPATSSGKWTYWRPMAEHVVELGTLHGREVGLPTHFHDENQITFVLSGRRRFVVEGNVIDLAAGQGTLIPAGIPHRSIAEPAGVVCLNAYVPAGRYAVGPMLKEIERQWRKSDQVRWSDLIAVIREHRQDEMLASPATLVRTICDKPVGEIAARMGMSREGFSRMFARRAGMPPHAFRLASRLNQARKLLRAGETIAAVAAETGFADQSHLGRWFRRVFGVTPGQYRLG